MLLIKGAEVYAPEYLGKKDVLIAGEKIERIGEDLPEYEGCQVIDGTGRIVAPGFIDRHVHITGGGGEGSFHTQAPQVQLSDLIRGGVTTVVGLLGTDGISRSTENLVAKAKALKEEGISAYCCCGAYGHPGPTITGSISRDIMFVDEIIGLKLAVSDHRAPNITVDELMDEMGFEAVFIGSGAGLPMFMNIPGVNYKGVLSANEFLTRINLMKAYLPDSDTPLIHPKKVAVVGGGNVAMDAARCAKRLGAEVYVVYRRGMEELPARREEVEHAEEEGIIFKTLCNPVEVLADENDDVKGIRCIRMELGEPDASGRRRPIEVPGSEFDVDVDCVIMALGTSPNPLIKSTTKGLEINKKGGIVVNEDGLTSRENVYAGGDAVTGAATVILAMGAGKTAAKAIDEALSKK